MNDINARKECQKVALQIAEELQEPNAMPKHRTLSKFNVLARLVRIMSQKEILEVGQELFTQGQKQDFHSVKQTKQIDAWKVYRDAVAEAGTPASFAVIAQWIKSKQVKGSEASNLIATQVKSIRYPTKELMEKFFELATCEEVTSQAYLNSTAIQSLASFLGQAQVNNHSAYSYYPTHAFGRLAPKKFTIVPKMVIPYLEQQLKKASKHQDSHQMLVNIRALGALAHPAILKVIEPYLEGKQQATEFERLAIVVSLGKLASHYPKLARSIYFKIYQNAAERYEVRVAAIFGIMRTNPDAPMLQRMAEMANNEPSSHISSAVRSALESAAELEHPDYRELSENAEAARQLLDDNSEDSEGVQYSSTNIQDWIMEEMNLAYKMQASHVGSEDTLLPKAAFLRVTKNMGGYKNRWNEYHAMISSVDELVNQVRDTFSSGSSNKNKHAKKQADQRSPRPNSRFNFDQIDNLLDIQADQREQLEGQILMKVLNAKRMFTINNETIDQLPKAIRRAAKQLQNGYQFNCTKFYNQEQITLGFPLASGMPFLYTYKTPTLAKAGGEIRLMTTPDLAQGNDDEVRAPNKVTFSAEINVLYATQVDARTGFVSVTDNQRFVAGVQKKVQVRLPLRMKIQVDAENNQVNSEMESLDDQEVTLFHASSLPYTQRQDIKASFDQSAHRDTQLVSIAQPKQFISRVGLRSTGMVLDINAKYEKQPIITDQVMGYLQARDYVALAMYATEIDTTEAYQVEVHTNRQDSTNDKVKIQLQFEGKNSFEADDSSSHPRDTRQKSTWQNEKLSQMRSQLFKLNSEWNNAQISGVQATLRFVGQKPAKFQANVVFGHSKVLNDQRFIVNLNADAIKYNKEINVRAYLQTPNTPTLNLNDALKAQDDGKMMIQAEYGDSNDSKKAQITMKAKLQQTEQYRMEVEKSDNAQECKRQMKQGDYAQEDCREAIYLAQVYDKYVITVDAENLSKQQKEAAHAVGHHAESALYYTLMSHKSNAQDRNGDNVQAEIQLSPDFEYCNITLKTPSRQIHYDYINLAPEYVRHIAAHPEKSSAQRVAAWATNDAFEGI